MSAMGKTMIAELKAVHSPDVDDLADYRPPSDAPFSVFVELFVGPHGEPGEEGFGIVVCNGRWLDKESSLAGPLLGRHHLVVTEWDWRAIENFFRQHVASCEGDTWSDVALLVARLAHWEFEDYRPFPGEPLERE